jgi:hypothetical protein
VYRSAHPWPYLIERGLSLNHYRRQASGPLEAIDMVVPFDRFLLSMVNYEESRIARRVTAVLRRHLVAIIDREEIGSVCLARRLLRGLASREQSRTFQHADLPSPCARRFSTAQEGPAAGTTPPNRPPAAKSDNGSYPFGIGPTGFRRPDNVPSRECVRHCGGASNVTDRAKAAHSLPPMRPIARRSQPSTGGRL